MKPRATAAISRALALAGLIAMNAALPAQAEADNNCWHCLQFPGWEPGCLGGQSTGAVTCEPTPGDTCLLGHVCS